MTDYIRIWEKKQGDDSTVSWLNYMGINHINGRNIFVGVGLLGTDTMLWNYPGAVYLAEMMPDHFIEWKALKRLGAIK